MNLRIRRRPTLLLMTILLLCSAAGLASAQDCSTGSGRYNLYIDDIEKTKKDAASYTPGSRRYYAYQGTHDFLKFALSKSAREDFFKRQGTAPDEVVCLSRALDELAVIARKTLPAFVPSGYTVRNPAEERIMKSMIIGVADLNIMRIGLDSATWRIEKNSLGIPLNRYKYGLVYAKNPKHDDGFCRAVWVNVVQEYTGGGTYGPTVGRFVRSDVVGCGAGM